MNKGGMVKPDASGQGGSGREATKAAPGPIPT